MEIQSLLSQNAHGLLDLSLQEYRCTYIQNPTHSSHTERLIDQLGLQYTDRYITPKEMKILEQQQENTIKALLQNGFALEEVYWHKQKYSNCLLSTIERVFQSIDRWAHGFYVLSSPLSSPLRDRQLLQLTKQLVKIEESINNLNINEQSRLFLFFYIRLTGWLRVQTYISMSITEQADWLLPKADLEWNKQQSQLQQIKQFWPHLSACIMLSSIQQSPFFIDIRQLSYKQQATELKWQQFSQILQLRPCLQQAIDYFSSSYHHIHRLLANTLFSMALHNNRNWMAHLLLQRGILCSSLRKLIRDDFFEEKLLLCNKKASFLPLSSQLKEKQQTDMNALLHQSVINILTAFANSNSLVHQRVHLLEWGEVHHRIPLYSLKKNFKEHVHITVTDIDAHALSTLSQHAPFEEMLYLNPYEIPLTVFSREGSIHYERYHLLLINLPLYCVDNEIPFFEYQLKLASHALVEGGICFWQASNENTPLSCFEFPFTAPHSNSSQNSLYDYIPDFREITRESSCGLKPYQLLLPFASIHHTLPENEIHCFFNVAISRFQLTQLQTLKNQQQYKQLEKEIHSIVRAKDRFHIASSMLS